VVRWRSEWLAALGPKAVVLAVAQVERVVALQARGRPEQLALEVEAQPARPRQM